MGPMMKASTLWGSLVNVDLTDWYPPCTQPTVRHIWLAGRQNSHTHTAWIRHSFHANCPMLPYSLDAGKYLILSNIFV